MMLSKKSFMPLGLLIFSLLLLSGAGADIGSGVRVALLKNQLAGGAQATIGFEVSNINPAGSAGITGISASALAELNVSGNTTFSNLTIRSGETKQFAFDIKAPNLDSNKDYTITFTITFSDDSLSKRKETLSVLADRVAPITSLTNVANSSYFKTKPINLQFSVIDPVPSSGVSTVSVVAGGSTYNLASSTGNTFSFDFNPATDGDYLISYSAADNAGNKEAQKQIDLIYDTTAPAVEIIQLPAFTNNPTPQIRFRFTDSFATYSSCEISIAGFKQTVLASANSATSITAPRLADGNYTVQVSCPDFAGNVGKSAETQFVIDTKPASLVNVIPSNGTFVSGNQSITLQFDKQIDINELKRLLALLQGDQQVDYDITTIDNKTFVLKPPAPTERGDYTLLIDKNLTDVAGNKLNSSYSFDFKNEKSPTGFSGLVSKFGARGALTGVVLLIAAGYWYFRKRQASGNWPVYL